MTGMVFDIQHFCVDDGPGIRTTVFFKGCPLRCLWCHNPEGLKRERQISFQEEKCALCGRCRKACARQGHVLEENRHTLRRENCVLCGKCAESCPVEAIRVMGREISAEEVLEDVLKDLPFYENSGGGITLSGGEPLYQSAFAMELMEKAKGAGLHVCVETSGFCSESVMRQAARWTDLFLLDVKETDEKRHLEYTGVDAEPIRRNARMLSDMGKEIILRCPVIPGCNDRREHFIAIARWSQELKTVKEIHLEPYHPFGVDKYGNLGMKAAYDNPEFMEKSAAEEWVRLTQEHTKIPVRIS